MKKGIIICAMFYVPLFVLIWFYLRVDTRDLAEMRRIAYSEYEYYLLDSRIDGRFFRGPELRLEDKDYFTFEWYSLIPRLGAVKIDVLVSPSRLRETIIGLPGDKKDWHYLYGTRGNPVNRAMLGFLFSLPSLPADSNDERNQWLGNFPLDSGEMEDVVKFIQIKGALINFILEKHKYPSTLYELDIQWRLLWDSWERIYDYHVEGKFVILGTNGANGVWDIDDSTMVGIIKDEKEHIYKYMDEFLVKIIPL